MRLSTRGRYAVRILLCIARHQHRGPVTKRVICEDEGISKDYIEQIIVPLKKAGLVEGLRGVKGGFLLTRAADEITVSDVLKASERNLCLVSCLMDDCPRADDCVIRPVWREASSRLHHYLDSVTLHSLMG